MEETTGMSRKKNRTARPGCRGTPGTRKAGSRQMKMFDYTRISMLERRLMRSKAIDRALTDFLFSGGISCPEEREQIRHRLVHLSLEKALMKTGQFLRHRSSLPN